MAVDLVCKMEMDEKTAKFTSWYKSKQYYFSAPGFKKALDKRQRSTWVDRRKWAVGVVWVWVQIGAI